MERKKKGFITGIVGMACNLVLAVAKLVVGVFSGSISIMSDSINNFGDLIGSGAVAFSFVFSGKKADKGHPFGHGRMEYIVALLIAVAIIFAGGEFLISSVERIISPQTVNFSWLFFGIILSSILVKLGMAAFYHFSNRKLKSLTLKAATTDSLQDVMVTSVTLVCYVVSRYTDFPVDGVVGAVISAFVLFNGIKMIRSGIDVMMGGQNNAELEREILSVISEEKRILGSHDLLLHDYGYNKYIASVHAELPATLTLTAAHTIVDDIEKKAFEKYNVDLVVHIDPVHTKDKVAKQLKLELAEKLAEIDESLSFHDFSHDEETKTITVDIVVKNSKEKEETLEKKLDGLKIGEYELKTYHFDFQ